MSASFLLFPLPTFLLSLPAILASFCASHLRCTTGVFVTLCECVFVFLPVWAHLCLLFCVCVCEVSQSCEVTDLSAKLPLLSQQTLTCPSVSFVRILVDIIQNSHSLNMSQNFTLNPPTGLWREWGPKMVITLHIKKNILHQSSKRKKAQKYKWSQIPSFFLFVDRFIDRTEGVNYGLLN